MTLSRQVKYVVFDNAFPVILPESVGHKQVRVYDDGVALQPTSAGFVRISTLVTEGAHGNESLLKVSCYGESTTLRLTSHGEADALLIRLMLVEEWPDYTPLAP